MSTVNIFQIALELWGALFCLIVAFIVAIGKDSEKAAEKQISYMLFGNAALLFADAMAYIFRGKVFSFAIGMTIIANYTVYVLQFLIAMCAVRYIEIMLEEQGCTPNPVYAGGVRLCGRAGIALVSINLLFPFVYNFDEQNRYYRLNGIAVTLSLAFVCLVLCTAMAVHYQRLLSRTMVAALVSYLVFPLAGTLAQTFLYGLSFINLGITISLCMLFIAHEKQQVDDFKAQTLQMARQETELTRQRIALMTSQMQPHFIFNSLATISCLCQVDPALAEQATDRFARYLRVNLDTLGNSRLVSFQQEMEHTKTYLWLEKLRFEEFLNIEYDLESVDFLMPPLTLQPIVENAVKHGICKKQEGGTVKITVRKMADGFSIVVEDDGVGFDPSVQPNDGRTHVGLTNTRERLERICMGTLTVESAVGVGTKVTVYIPGIGTEGMQSRKTGCKNEKPGE